MLPGFILSCRLITWYVPRTMQIHEVMQTTLPSHLINILDVWHEGYRLLPWSALLPLLCFGAFEAMFKGRRKAAIRQVVLIIVALVTVGLNSLTAWSVIDAHDQNNLRVIHKHFKEQLVDGELEAEPVGTDNSRNPPENIINQGED